MNKYRIKEFIKIHNGAKYNHLKSGIVPLYGSGGLMGYVDDYLYDGEAILLPRKGTLDNIMYTTGKLWTVDTMYYATIDESLADPYYIYNYLAQLNLSHLDSGSTLPSMTKVAYYDLEVELPSRAAQIKLIQCIRSINQKIELNNRTNAELEAMAKTLYDYWFVQFDFPDANGKPYKTSGGRMVYNPLLKREIPDGWIVEPLTKSCDVIDCLHSKKPDLHHESDDCYLLQLENITDSRQIDLEQQYFVSKQDYLEWTSRIEVKHFDIVMTNAGRIAAFAQIPKGIKCGIGRNITAISPNHIKPNYFYMSLAGNDIQKQIFSNLDHGAFFKSFNVKGIKKLFLTRPSGDIESRFEELMSPIIEKRNAAIAENAKLASLRDWLLPMLMNGQVTVN